MTLVDENKGWLQVKGDPVIRAQVFHQHRQQSLFDERSGEKSPYFQGQFHLQGDISFLFDMTRKTFF